LRGLESACFLALSTGTASITAADDNAFCACPWTPPTNTMLRTVSAMFSSMLIFLLVAVLATISVAQLKEEQAKELIDRVKRLEEHVQSITNFEEMMNAGPSFDSLSFASTTSEDKPAMMKSGGCCRCSDGSQHRVGGWCPWACAKCVVICGGNGGCSCGPCKKTTAFQPHQEKQPHQDL